MQAIRFSIKFGITIASFVLFNTAILYATIIVSGGVFPNYNGIDDPWNVLPAVGNPFGRLLLPSTGTINLNGTSVINSELAVIRGPFNVSGFGATWKNRSEVAFFNVNNQNSGNIALSGLGSRIYIGDVAPLSADFLDTNENAFVISHSPGTSATFEAQNGATTNIGGNTYIGFGGVQFGTLIIEGEDTKYINTGDFTVGHFGSASLTINAGALIQNEIGYVGRLSGGSGSVVLNGIGSTWENRSKLIVGSKNGAGVVQMFGNGTRLLVGDQAANYASTLSANEPAVVVGGFAPARFQIDSGSVVSNPGNAHIGRSSNSIGQVIVEGMGSRWQNSGTIVLGSSSANSQGSLLVKNGGEVTALNIFVESDSWVFGDGTIATGLISSSGGVAPGDPQGTSLEERIGILTLNASYSQQAEGQLNISVGGTSAGENYDQLRVTGAAILDGLLDVSLPGASDTTYSPLVGDEFEILFAAGGINGKFSEVELPQLDTGLGWDLSYTDPQRVTLSITDFLANPGDFNFDAEINDEDLAILESGFGNVNASQSQGDTDLDGDVDGQDFLSWQRNFTPEVIEITQAVVPEPMGIVLLFVGIAICCNCRRHP